VPGALSTPDLTPFGYLRNPGHRARSWGDVEGGNLRTGSDWPGVEWVYPLQRDPIAGAGITITSPCARTSHYRTALVMEIGDVRFFLVDADTLAALGPVDRALEDRRWGPLPQPHAFAETSTAQWRIAVVARAETEALAGQRAADAVRRAEQRLAELLREDETFRETCPRLEGDWPGGWAEGVAIDFETTRMLVQPPGGIFADVWPAWMTAWPRVVFAEGTLDMLRLAYADPTLAQRAVLSMLRAAPMPNVPCVFENGGYNMVAADGSRCGTSPAWCLPFLSLQLLYLRTLDRAWLGEVYPFLAAYLEWWLVERIDAEGWVVYKCTWESGEDGNPRLDPSGSGDGVIDRRVRPVELQATVAHAAQVLGFFARELGLDPTIWEGVGARYRERTRALFDPDTGRYRDWLVEEQRFQIPRPDRPYWGVDTGRFSPMGLTPALIGEPVARKEIELHAAPPWTLWPSWTYALVESAAAAGVRLGEVVADILERVYAVTTRRTLDLLERPLPGAAPEFWPTDWSTYQGHDGYGWGATTANLLIRHLFGFQESHATESWTAILAPAFPESFLVPGRRYAIRRLNYRGLLFDLALVVTADGLRAELDLDEPRRCRAGADYDSAAALLAHRFPVVNGEQVAIILAPYN
jgi:hypothetical protein